MILFIVTWQEIAPNRFLVGATLDDENSPEFLIVDCLGGNLTEGEFWIVDSPTIPTRVRPQSELVLWQASAEPGSPGAGLPAGQPFDLSMLRPPNGLVTTTSFAGWRTDDGVLLVTTSRQAYNVGFRRTDLQHGRITVGREKLSPSDFKDEAASFC